jgi:CHAT domain-containing protein/tetratricopeptide (TPR) repeat protein
MKIAILKIGYCFLSLLFFQTNLSAQHDTIIANELLDKAIDIYDSGDYISARKPLQKVLSLRLKYYPEDHLKIEDIYYWLGSNEEGIRNSEKALEYYRKGVEIAIKREGPQSIPVADFYMDMANTLDQMYKVNEAKKYYQKTLAIYKKEFGPESSEVGNVLMNIGYGQRKMGNYRDAEEYYKKAADFFQKSSDPNSKDFYRIYINQCNLLFDQGNYDSALDFAEKALKIKLMHYDTLHPSVYKYFGNIGRIYQAKGMPEEALPYAIKALDIAEKSRGKTHPETAGLLGELASVYADIGQLDKALNLQKKSVKIQEKGLSPTHPYLVAGYEDIGRTYEDKKEYDKALDYYQFTIKQYQKADYVPKHLIAVTLRKIADVHFKKGNIKKALEVIRQGLKNISPDFDFEENDLYKNPSLDLIQAEIEFLDLLQFKSKYLYANYKKENKKSDLEQALNTSELAIELIEKIRKSYQSESARQFLNSDTAPIYERAIEQAFDLYLLTNDPTYLFKAFELSEKSRASILWQSLNDRHAFTTTNIPESELKKINELHSEITGLEETNNEQKDQKSKNDIQNQIFDLKRNYEKAIAKLEKDYPKYYQLKYASSVVNSETVLQNLPDNNTALIEYFYSDNQLFIFVFSNHQLKGFRLPINFDLQKSILALRQINLQSIVSDESANSIYLNNLYQLHEILIQPILSEINKTQKLIIIPHGVLQLLSFESLAPISNTLDFRKQNYLLKNYTIQYAWSASLWIDTPTQVTHSTVDFIGFAPGFKNDAENLLVYASKPVFRTNEPELPHSIPEVQKAASFFHGKTFLERDASESKFYLWAPKSKIIHLATHAIANEQFPLESGLVFSEANDSIENGFINTLEIYNLNLSADLAVMSACNTGYGKLEKGEGIISLGRAFMYAGCKSVISSLWLANDESTNTIMQDFYKYSAEGLSKDQALKNAKLNYLNQADPVTAHPYFWANLVGVGDMSPLRPKPLPWKIYLGLLLSSLVIIYWFSSRQKA